MSDATSAPDPGTAPWPVIPAPGCDPPIVPAPWLLRYDGLILVLAARTRAAGAPGLAGRLSAVSFVDYSLSPVGPYRELLHISRVARWPGAFGPTVRDIWVDSVSSARSGNANWGLTKSVISVDRSDPEPGAHRWTATDGASTLADVVHRPIGPPLPVAKPRKLGRLVQHRDHKLFQTPVSARALVRLTRITGASMHPDLLVDLDRYRIGAAFSISHGRMRFHAAQVTPTR